MLTCTEAKPKYFDITDFKEDKPFKEFLQAKKNVDLDFI